MPARRFPPPWTVEETVRFLIKIKVAFFNEREALANLEVTCLIIAP